MTNLWSKIRVRFFLPQRPQPLLDNSQFAVGLSFSFSFSLSLTPALATLAKIALSFRNALLSNSIFAYVAQKGPSFLGCFVNQNQFLPFSVRL